MTSYTHLWRAILYLFNKLTGISLNNTGGDEVKFFDPAGVLVDSMVYTETAEEGHSFGREKDDFVWTRTATPGRKNVVTATDQVDDTQISGVKTVEAVKKVASKTIANKKVVPAKKAPKKVAGVKISAGVRVNLSQIREQDKGSIITTTGTVAVLPGILGTQYFYIVDNLAGVQIYMSKKDFPELFVGDQLQVTGQVSESYGETRINIQTKSQIKVLEHGTAPLAQSVELASIGEPLEGSLVQNTAQVTDVKAGYLYLDDGSGEIKVYFKKGSGITRDDAALGTTLQVTGIVSQTQAGYQILPRSKDDLFLIASSTLALPPTRSASSNDIKKFMTAILASAIAILLGLLIKMYRLKATSK